jgi:hypothetical protein
MLGKFMVHAWSHCGVGLNEEHSQMWWMGGHTQGAKMCLTPNEPIWKCSLFQPPHLTLSMHQKLTQHEKIYMQINKLLTIITN